VAKVLSVTKVPNSVRLFDGCSPRGNSCANERSEPECMDRTDVRRTATRDLVCESCGRLPHPRRGRLTLAKLVAVFPIELLLHALVTRQDLPFIATVAVLTITTTILVTWVVEPSALRLLGGWLHAPALRTHRLLSEAAALWRVWVIVDDKPDPLENLVGQLGPLGAENPEPASASPLPSGTERARYLRPRTRPGSDLVAAVHASGTTDVHIWPTTALALVDNSTKALALAARVSENPSELPLATAELLGAHVVADHVRVTHARAGGHGPHEAELRLPTP
jgi:hypothetical protein